MKRNIRFVVIVGALLITLVTFVVGMTMWAPLGYFWSTVSIFSLLALLAGVASWGSARH